MEKFLTKKEILEASGVPANTFNRWLRLGKIVAADFDDQGKPLFADVQVEQAKALHKPEHAPKKKLAAQVDNPEPDTATVEAVDAPAEDICPVNVTSAVETAADGEDVQDARADVPAVEVVPAAESVVVEAEPVTIETAIVNCDTFIVEPVPAAPETISLDERADRIRAIEAVSIIAIGFELIAAKNQVEHGGWADWLRKEFDWDIRTAQNYMSVAERFGNTKTFSHLGKSKLIKLLALPAGDETAFVEAQAAKGRPVELQSARELQSAVKDWKEAQVGGKYFNVTGSEKNIAVVDELNYADVNAQESLKGVSNDIDGIESASAEIDSEASFLSSRELVLIPDENSGVVEVTEPAKKLPPVAYNRNSTVKWYTPADIIEAAREVFGGVIDLDPASDDEANQIVKAEKFYSVEDDGLLQDWRGRIWLNPPFTNGLIDKFVDKLLAEFESGRVTASIVLTDNATETRWFRKLADSSTAIVFTTGRINFLKGGTFEEGNPTRGQTFFYQGDAPETFFRVFAKFGWACKVVMPEPSLEERKGLF